MKNVAIIAITAFLLLGCKNSEIWMTKPANYDLNGNVSFCSEKEFTVIHDEDGNLTPDTLNPYFIIINRTFDKNNKIHTIEYFDKDSALLLKVEYYKDGNSIQFDKKMNKTHLTKIISFKENILNVKSYNPKLKEITSEAWTKYK